MSTFIQDEAAIDAAYAADKMLQQLLGRVSILDEEEERRMAAVRQSIPQQWELWRELNAALKHQTKLIRFLERACKRKKSADYRELKYQVNARRTTLRSYEVYHQKKKWLDKNYPIKLTA